MSTGAIEATDNQPAADREVHKGCDRKASIQQFFAGGLMTLLFTEAKDVGLVYDLAIVAVCLALVALLISIPPRGIWRKGWSSNADDSKKLTWITWIKAGLNWVAAILLVVCICLMGYGALCCGMFPNS